MSTGNFSFPERSRDFPQIGPEQRPVEPLGPNEPEVVSRPPPPQTRPTPPPSGQDHLMLLLKEFEKAPNLEAKRSIALQILVYFGSEAKKIAESIPPEVQKQNPAEALQQAMTYLNTAAISQEAMAYLTYVASDLLAGDALFLGSDITAGVVSIINLGIVARLSGQIAQMQAKLDELKVLALNDPKMQPEVDLLQKQISELQAKKTANLTLAVFGAAKSAAFVIRETCELLSNEVATATQVGGAIGAAGSALSFGYSMQLVRTAIQEIKTVTDAKDEVKSTIDELKAKGANENLIVALELKHAYLEKAKLINAVGNFTKAFLKLLSAAKGAVSSVAVAFAVKSAAISALTPVGWALIGGSLAVTLTFFLENERANVANAIKQVPLKLKARGVDSQLKATHQDTQSKLQTAKKILSGDSNYLAVLKQALQPTKKRLEDAHEMEQQAKRELEGVVSKISTVKTPKEREKLEAKKVVLENKVAGYSKQVDAALKLHEERVEAVMNYEANISRKIPSFLHKKADIISKLQQQKQALQQQMASMDVVAQEKWQADQLGASVQDVAEFRAALKQLLQDDPAFKDAFAAYFKDHTTSELCKQFEQDPLSTIVSYLFV